MSDYSLENKKYICAESEPDIGLVKGDIYTVIDGHNCPDDKGYQDITFQDTNGEQYTLQFRHFFFMFNHIDTLGPLLYNDINQTIYRFNELDMSKLTDEQLNNVLSTTNNQQLDAEEELRKRKYKNK